MEIYIRETGSPHVKLLEIEGRMDAYTHTVFQEKIHSLLQEGNSKIICDLSKVEYIGPTALRTLILAIQETRSASGDIKLACLPAYIKKKLEPEGEIFYETTQDAISSFGLPKEPKKETIENPKNIDRAVAKTEKYDKDNLPFDLLAQEQAMQDKNPVEESSVTCVYDSSVIPQTSTQQFAMPKSENSEKLDLSYPLAYRIDFKIKENYFGELYSGKEIYAQQTFRTVWLQYLQNQNKLLIALLREESENIFSFHHQNIQSLYKLISLENKNVLVMENVPGVPLSVVLEKLKQSNRVFPPSLACFVIYNLCLALEYANQQRDKDGNFIEAVHGEINSENIMVSKQGNIKLLGLGINKIKVMLQFQQNLWDLNLEFFAPEVVATTVPTKLGDIFSLGVLFYEMLTGTKPFSQQQMQQQNLIAPISPCTFNKKINSILEGIVLRCIQPNNDRRFQSFQDLALQLEEVMSSKGFLFTQAIFQKFIENNHIFS